MNKVLSFYYKNRLGWIRFFGGAGIKWKDVKLHPLIFSERNGYKKYIKVGNWIISYLGKVRKEFK